MAAERKRVLVTVKTYPNPSKKYGETVCCAGIDLATNQWIRLYPIPYRDLDSSSRFSKYSIIEVRCSKATRDHRIESYKVDADSIEVPDTLDTKNKWRARKQIVLPTVSPSFCQILDNVKDGKSLGVFKPCNIEFSWKKTRPKSDAEREACYAQLSFFDKRKQAIEQIPFDFYYHFKCANTETCQGHKLLIIDWELGQSYRKWRYDYPDEGTLLAMIRKRWLDEMCAPKKDVFFFVGNQKRFHGQFMVLGVFWPPK